MVSRPLAGLAMLSIAMVSGCASEIPATQATSTTTALPQTSDPTASSTPTGTATTAATATTVAPVPATVPYVVVAGDSLYAIADRHDVTVEELVAANGWTDGLEHLLLPGDTIGLPADASVSTTPPSSTSAADVDPVNFVPVDQEAPRQVGLYPEDGRSQPLTDPLVDGVYHSASHRDGELTPVLDGERIIFVLDEWETTEACFERLGDEADCYGGGFYSQETATISLPIEADIPVFVGSFSYRMFRTDVAALAELIANAGTRPLQDEPGIVWDMWVKVAGGQVVGVAPRFSS